MTGRASSLRDVCRLLGGLALDGAQGALLREIRRDGTAATLGRAMGGDLGAALAAMQRALDEEEAESLAVEYTRLMVANGAGGARSALPVPPWEDCYVKGQRAVRGARSQAVLRAYAAAGLGFDGITKKPADHVGLELCFIAALLDEEERGERDAAARTSFVDEHLRAFSPAFGRALADAAGKAFWRETGRAIALLPTALADETNGRAAGS